MIINVDVVAFPKLCMIVKMVCAVSLMINRLRLGNYQVQKQKIREHITEMSLIVEKGILTWGTLVLLKVLYEWV